MTYITVIPKNEFGNTLTFFKVRIPNNHEVALIDCYIPLTFFTFSKDQFLCMMDFKIVEDLTNNSIIFNFVSLTKIKIKKGFYKNFTTLMNEIKLRLLIVQRNEKYFQEFNHTHEKWIKEIESNFTLKYHNMQEIMKNFNSLLTILNALLIPNNNLEELTIKKN